MGVDLTLMPLHSDDDTYGWVAFDMFELERRHELWPLIEALPRHKTPSIVSTFRSTIESGEHEGEDTYGPTPTDPYGNPLEWTTAADLLTLKGQPTITDNFKNRAVWAYLGELPPDWKIILFWH